MIVAAGPARKAPGARVPSAGQSSLPAALALDGELAATPGVIVAVIEANGHFSGTSAVHTNSIEGFWSLVKRGMVGTMQKDSRRRLPLYVVEFQFRYNNRSNPDIFGAAIKAC